MAYRNTVVVAELWDSDCQYYRHTKTRKTTIRDLFTGLFIKTYPQYLKNLKKLIFVFLQTKDFFRYFACYDFEAYFSQQNLPGNHASKNSMCC